MKTYRIESSHSVYTDDYNEGEGSFVNGYEMDAIIKAETPQQAIEKYFETVVGFDFDFNHASIEDNILFYSNLVDGSNIQASKQQIESWKKGKCILYSDNINVIIYELKRVEL
jgi:hypothetical protein